MYSALLMPSWHPALQQYCLIKWNYALNHCPLALIYFLSLSPSSHTPALHFFLSFWSHYSILGHFYDIYSSWHFPPFPLSLSSSLFLSVNYPCSLICRHPSNLRFPVMNQAPPFSSASSSSSLSPPLPPLPISAKQLTNWLALINRETHAQVLLFLWRGNDRGPLELFWRFSVLLFVSDSTADKDVLSRREKITLLSAGGLFLLPWTLNRKKLTQ